MSQDGRTGSTRIRRHGIADGIMLRIIEDLEDLTPAPVIAFVLHQRVQPYRRGARACPHPERNDFFLFGNHSAHNYPMTDVMLHIASVLGGNTLEQAPFAHKMVWISFGTSRCRTKNPFNI